MMNGCVYRTAEDKCELYSDYGKGIVSHCDFADCEGKKPTNADRIRSMSDEELAEWLDRLITHCNDGPCFNCFMQKACLTSMLDWLRQEATDDP